MSDASEIAAREGVSSSDVEIINVQEVRLDERTVQRQITYRISHRATQAAVNEFIRQNDISDARGLSAFYEQLNSSLANIQSGSSNHMQELRSAFANARRYVEQQRVPLHAPSWYKQLQWSEPVNVATMTPSQVPDQRSGCYVFCAGHGTLVPESNILYVGRAYNLRNRLRTYYNHIRCSKDTKHLGAYLLGHYATQLGADRIFVRWTLLANYRDFEGALMDYLAPHFNSRDELAMCEDTEEFDDIT